MPPVALHRPQRIILSRQPKTSIESRHPLDGFYSLLSLATRTIEKTKSNSARKGLLHSPIAWFNLRPRLHKTTTLRLPTT